MFLSVGETDALLTHVRRRAGGGIAANRIPARLDQLIIEGLLFSGLRNSEFCALTVGDVHVEGSPAVFVVRGAGREERVVHVPGELARLTQKWIAEVRPALLPRGGGPSDPSLPLVVNERGRGYERTGLYRRVVRILTEAGLGARASVQLLRHTYGYLAYLRTGGNLLFVQRQLGHAHPMVTAIYAPFVDESYAAMADRVAGAASARHGRARIAKPVAETPPPPVVDEDDLRTQEWLL